MMRTGLAGLALLFVVPAMAQDAPADPPRKVRNATVYGEEPCPKAADPEEIVVCARLGESERYRIPKRFRDQPSQASGDSAWSARVDTAMEAARIGRPNSCSPVGDGGQTGCTQAMLRQWFAERRQTRAAESDIP
ncbi:MULTISPECIES: hypothetical protein [unclassified Sphingomonas]|uniref:hypothetical protein n=1 Tax=unclassified Sphingomonas TaxID=196159 RepID=UPI000A5ADB0C|nr:MULTISPECIES: hypothetical protein [unclassified Sphingomonas]